MQSLQPLKTKFETYLKDQTFDRKPNSLYDPFSYMFSLGGKRIRPVLLLASSNIFGGDFKGALPLAMSIELFHNFSLIHDDIMDEADIRRGKQTIHKKFGDNTAILSGDAMFVCAYEYLFKANKFELNHIFTQTAKEVCEGQQMDMEFETRFDVSIEQYIEMITLKTAVLIGCSLKMGAILSNASLENQQLIYEFGKNLGLSFQLKDDILDTYADQAKFGKQIGGDIIQNKRTYLMLHALSNSSNELQATYKKILTSKSHSASEKIAEVKKIFEKSHSKQAAEEKANFYYEKCISNLDQLTHNGFDVSILRDYAIQILKREV